MASRASAAAWGLLGQPWLAAVRSCDGDNCRRQLAARAARAPRAAARPLMQVACRPKTCSLHRRGVEFVVTSWQLLMRTEASCQRRERVKPSGIGNPACCCIYIYEGAAAQKLGGAPRRSVLWYVAPAVAWRSLPAVEGDVRMVRACAKEKAGVSLCRHPGHGGRRPAAASAQHAACATAVCISPLAASPGMNVSSPIIVKPISCVGLAWARARQRLQRA